MTQALLVSNTLLWLLTLIAVCAVAVLARQVAALHARVAPAGAMMPGRGFPIGAAPAPLPLTDVQGRALVVGGMRAHAQLVLFVSPTCPICKALVPVAQNLAGHEGLDLLFASDGDDIETHRRYVQRMKISVCYVLSAQLGRTHQVAKLPFALLIDRAGVLRARGLVNSREHLESLVEAQRQGVPHLQAFLQAADSPESARDETR